MKKSFLYPLFCLLLAGVCLFSCGEKDESPDQGEAIAETEADETASADAVLNDVSLGKTLAIPASWRDIAVVETPDEDGGAYTTLFRLCEAIAHEEGCGGYVWQIDVCPVETEQDWLIPDGVTTDGHYLLGEDADYRYFLRHTPGTDIGVVFYANNEDPEREGESRENYDRLKEESTEVLERFLRDNGVPANPLCPAEDCYAPRVSLDRTVVLDGCGLVLSVPEHWEDIAVMTSSDSFISAREKTAYEERQTGYVWGIQMFPLDEEITWEQENVSMPNGMTLIGTDERWMYFLSRPTDVQYLYNEDNIAELTESRVRYEQIQAESQAVIAQFLTENGITPNPLCPVDDPSLESQLSTEPSFEAETPDSIESGERDSADEDELGDYYLSITGSFVTDDGTLSEVYAVYDFESGAFDRLYEVEATSSYPCCVCDLDNGVVYFSAAEETELEQGKIAMINNVYAYHLDSGETEQITDYGWSMNRMIPVGDRLYFAGGKRSTIAVQFGWIDLNTNEVVIPDLYGEVRNINVRDIEYSDEEDAVYLSWYALSDQNALDQAYYQSREADPEHAVWELAPRYLDRVDLDSLAVKTLLEFPDYQLELFSVGKRGEKILMYGIDAKPPMRLYENGETVDFVYPGTALTAMSPDGSSVFFIRGLDTSTNGVPNTMLQRYDFETGEVVDLMSFDFYVNNMVLLKK